MKKGCVTLVGAGPGDPGLLTLAGKAALEKADVVLYDRLAAPALLAHAPAAAVLVDVGKRKGDHPVPQDEINRLLLDYAQQGNTVVRLKGGDPYLFGRGAEELALLAENGIPFRVVSGVTSAIAAPASVGIPVTHRDCASSVHIFTGHARDGGGPPIPYADIARLPGTLLFPMSLSAVDDICAGLVAAGMAPDTPAAVIENGTLPNRRRVAATLSALPAAAREHGVHAPALLVVGKVCELADELARDEKRILVVSSRATASGLAELLRGRGCRADEYAGISLNPLPLPDSLWGNLPGYDWIVLTSRNGVERLFQALRENRVDLRLAAEAKFAVVGFRTAAELERHGIYADVIPERNSAAGLAETLPGTVTAGQRVLLFRARDGDPALADALRTGGAVVDDIAAYETLPNPPEPDTVTALAAGEYDGVTFTSASAVEAFAAAGMRPGRAAVFCIGDATAAAARRHGMEPIVSPAADLAAMADMVVERLGKS